MIQQIELQNFQAHDKTILPLELNVNVIIGPSDVGKSSIFRALRWVVFNRPSGNAFIRHGSKQTQVTITAAAGTVERLKTKSKNEYIINGASQKAVGSGVPDPVGELLQLDEINFQGQHDSPYLLSETAGEVGRQLNRMVDLDVIDRTLKGLAGRVRDANRERERAKDAVRNLRDEEKSLARVPELLERLESAESLREGIRKGVERADRLETVIQQAKRAHTTLQSLPPVESIGQLIERAERLSVAAREASKGADRLVELVDSARRLRKRLDKDKEREKDLEQEIKESIGEECPLCGNIIQ